MRFDLKNKWDEYVKYCIGFSLMLFCTYILISDISFLFFYKESRTMELRFDENSKHLSFKYINERTGKTVSIQDYEIEKKPDKVMNYSNIYYNPFFDEDIYFDSISFPKTGEILLFILGIVIIYILTMHKW